MNGQSVFEIAKTDDEKRLIFGWASVSADLSGQMIEDLQGDMLGIDELEHAAYEYVLGFRDAGERHDPALRKKGRLVESVVFTPEKVKAMGITGPMKEAWWVGFYIDDDQAWEKIKSGEYEMFSIEGRAVREDMAKSFGDLLAKFNENHDPDDGKFSSGSGGSAAPAASSGTGSVLGKLSSNDYGLTKEGYAQFKSSTAAKRYSDECGKGVKLSPDQKDSLGEYQVSSANMNNRLRAGDAKSDGYKIKDIDQAIGKSKLPDNVLLFRGIDGEGIKAMGLKSNGEADLKAMIGKPLSDKAYMSTTADRAIMDKFMQSPAGGEGVGIIIKASKGMNALPVSAGNGLYGNRESEFILPRNAGLRITGVVKQGNRSYLVAQYGDDVSKGFRDALSELDVETGVQAGTAASFAELMAHSGEPVKRKSLAKSFLEWLQKFNPYHDQKGKFTSGDTATMFSATPSLIASNAKLASMMEDFTHRRNMMRDAAMSLGIGGGNNTQPASAVVNGKFRINLLNMNNGGGSDPLYEQHVEEANPKPIPKITVSMPQTPGKAVDWHNVSDADFMDTLKKQCPGYDQIIDSLDRNGIDLSAKWGSSPLVDTKQNGDMALTEIYKHRGFNALPTMMDKAAVKQYIDAKKTPELYRGMGTSTSGQSGADKQTRFAQDPLHFAGLGVLGNGTYAAQTPTGKKTYSWNTGLKVARAYSHGAQDGTVRMTLDKTAKKATFAAVRKEQQAFQYRVMSATHQGLLSLKQSNALMHLTDDPGRFAALRGYDAYYERGKKNSGANASHPFWVLLNRGKIIIQNERYT